MTSNLYRIDDVLLRAGAIFGAFALLAVSAIVSREGLSLSSAAFLIVVIACPLTLIVTGRSIRRREKLMVEMWRLIEAKGQVPVQQLYEMTSFGRRQIAAAVQRINRRGNAMLVWDEATSVIRDERVRRLTMTHSEDCQSCGGSVNIEVSTTQTDYVCPFCGGGLDCTRINPLIDGLQAREELSRQQQALSTPAASPPEKKINVTLFIVLLILFWPAAVVYALKAHNG